MCLLHAHTRIHAPLRAREGQRQLVLAIIQSASYETFNLTRSLLLPLAYTPSLPSPDPGMVFRHTGFSLEFLTQKASDTPHWHLQLPSRIV